MTYGISILIEKGPEGHAKLRQFLLSVKPMAVQCGKLGYFRLV